MRWLCALLLSALPALAQEPADAARSALEQLDAAARRLEAAEGARDRVQALTETIQAYEAGLAAMREGLRRASIREDQLRRKLESQDQEISRLVGVLLAINPGRNPTSFLHPDGPLGSARAGMVLAELTPTLNRAASALRTDLEDVEALAVLQREAVRHMQRGLNEVQTARLSLNTAMAERTDLPQRFVEDPTRTAILLSSAETLDAFSSGLAELAVGADDWTPPRLEDRIGSLPLPVRGVTLRHAGEADAAGISRPGILLATRTGALVTSPTAATIRYSGPLLDLGNVIILEPRAETLFIFAGLDVAYGEAGQVIPEDTPLGLMGGLNPDIARDRVDLASLGGGSERSETLYIEVRQDNVPQDPANWFRTHEDE